MIKAVYLVIAITIDDTMFEIGAYQRHSDAIKKARAIDESVYRASFVTQGWIKHSV